MRIRSGQEIEIARELGPAMGTLANMARTDPAVFCQFVLRDEQTGFPITLAPMHEEWQDLLSQHERIVLWAHTESGKTSAISIGRTLWEIGRNPNIRILVLSSSAGQAKKIVKAIKNYVERSLEFRMVFPGVVPDKSDTSGMWREDAFIVKRQTMSKDPTMQAVGYNGNVLGGRYDLIIIDDYLTDENTYSDRQREKYFRWLKSTIEGRKTGRSRLVFIGNAWHIDDAMHRYAAEEATVSRKYPVRGADGQSSWPEVWPNSRIEKEILNRGPIESQRSLFCDPVSDAERKFKLEYCLKALAKGDGLDLAWALTVVPPGYRTITGVDLAVTKRDSSDETALVTIAVDDRPAPIGNQERQILDVDAGKWSGPEIVGKIFEVQHRYNSIVIVESNAAQLYIKQFVEDRAAVPVKAFYTGRNKVDPAFGIQSLAIEMSAGKWVFPNQGGASRGIHARMNDQVRKLLGEMLRYDPASHTGDRLVACWLAREGVRMTSSPAGTGKRPRRT